jgi:hypothetical protein
MGGHDPTASAAVSIVDIARSLLAGSSPAIPCVHFQMDHIRKSVRPMNELMPIITSADGVGSWVFFQKLPSWGS